ncbi:MAG: sensor domain-containing protein [Sciscionella sp.]
MGLPLLFLSLALLRGYSNLYRAWAGKVLGITVARPYRTLPPGGNLPKLLAKALAVITDPTTWRDLPWTLVSSTAGVTLSVTRTYLILSLPWSIVLSILWTCNWGIHSTGIWLVFNQRTADLAWVGGVLGTLVALWVNPRLRLAHARMTATMLAPTRKAALAARVEELTTTRAETAGCWPCSPT